MDLHDGQFFPLQDWDSENHDIGHIDWNDDILFDNMMSHTTNSNTGNLLTNSNIIRKPSEQINNDNPDKKKISDTVIYGPRFCLLFDSYCAKYSLKIDTSKHLMSLCSENLVQFVNWVRESDQQMTWVSNTLYDYDYLRPEVRNGIVMIVIYTFAAIKATRDPSNMDMFTTLQDVNEGLAIANKFSLKIYNDPLLFLTFLKTSISALIDAGVIPDNERQNQPKRTRVTVENKEEHAAYLEIVRRITALLDTGDLAGAKNIVQHVTSYWQVRGKVRMSLVVLDIILTLSTISSSAIAASSAVSTHLSTWLQTVTRWTRTIRTPAIK
jgi:hypothetical protein